MNIGEWIKRARKAAGLTGEQLGDQLGVGKANVSSWEHGRHDASYRQVIKIAQLAKMTLPLPPGVSLPPSGMSPQAFHIADKIDAIRDERLQRAVYASCLRVIEELSGLDTPAEQPTAHLALVQTPTPPSGQ